MSGTDPGAAARRPPACPICRKPAHPRFRPFCSARCADVDLGRWFGGTYHVPADADETAEEGLDDPAPGGDDSPGPR